MSKRAVARRLRPGPADVGRWAPPLGVLAIVIIVACIATTTLPFKVGTGDIFLSILNGRYLATYEIPHVDVFTYTAPGRPIVEHHWLFDLLLYLAYTAGGAAGLLLLQALLMSAVYALGIAIARILGASGSVLALGFPLLTFLAFPRTILRPHMLSWLSMLAMHLVLYKVRLRQWKPWRIWGLVPLFGCGHRCMAGTSSGW